MTQHTRQWNSLDQLLLAGSGFALGLAVGLFARGAADQLRDRGRAAQWRRESERTLTYDENLPDSLTREDPAPGQPRFGGTGALGVSPAVADASVAGDSRRNPH